MERVGKNANAGRRIRRGRATALAAALLTLLWAGGAVLAQEDDEEKPVRDDPVERAFQRIRDRLARGMTGYDQRGLGVVADADGLDSPRPSAEFRALPGGYGSWDTCYRVRVEGGVMWVPVPPRAQHLERGEEHRWTEGRLRLTLRQDPRDFKHLLSADEALAGEDLTDPFLMDAFADVRKEFEFADRADRFDVWWRMLRAEARGVRPGTPFGRRVLAMYLLHRRSHWPTAVTAYANSHVRAFVAEPKETRILRRDGSAETRWVAQAWLAPAEGNPLVMLEYSEKDDFELGLSADMVLRHVAGCRFEREAARGAMSARLAAR